MWNEEHDTYNMDVEWAMKVASAEKQALERPGSPVPVDDNYRVISDGHDIYIIQEEGDGMWTLREKYYNDTLYVEPSGHSCVLRFREEMKKMKIVGNGFTVRTEESRWDIWLDVNADTIIMSPNEARELVNALLAAISLAEEKCEY